MQDLQMNIATPSFRRRPKSAFAERAKEHCRKFTAFLFSNVGIILLVVLYTITGSFMFRAIENVEVKRPLITDLERNESIAILWNITDHLNTFNEEEYKELVGQVAYNFQQKIVSHIHKGFGEDRSWTFSSAFLFSLTVITTIGYGNLTPKSDFGKIATIIYSIIGMPLFLLYLSNIGDILAKSFKWIYAKVCLCRICPGLARRRALRERRKTRDLTWERDMTLFDESDSFSSCPGNGYSHKSEPYNTSSSSNNTYIEDEDDNFGIELDSDSQSIIVPITTCVVIMISYIFFGAMLFGDWEKWSLLDGSYFCFISLTSIGFGDFVPGDRLLTSKGQNIVEISFIFCAVYLLLGMALIAMCFNLMQEQVIHSMRAFKRLIRNCFRCE